MFHLVAEWVSYARTLKIKYQATLFFKNFSIYKTDKLFHRKSFVQFLLTNQVV